MFLLVQLIMSSLSRFLSVVDDSRKKTKKIRCRSDPLLSLDEFLRIVSPTIVSACLPSTARKSLMFRRRKSLAQDCENRVPCFSRCPRISGYRACHEDEKTEGLSPRAACPQGRDASRTGLYESRNIPIAGMPCEFREPAGVPG